MTKQYDIDEPFPAWEETPKTAPTSMQASPLNVWLDLSPTINDITFKVSDDEFVYMLKLAQRAGTTHIGGVDLAKLFFFSHKVLPAEAFDWMVRGLGESCGQKFETSEMNDDGTYDWCQFNNICYVRGDK